MRTLTTSLLGILLFVAQASFLFALPQESEEPPLDPYTNNDPALMEAAGIIRYGPFPFLGDKKTEKIEELLGDIDLLWVETEHFKIGSALGEYKLTVDRVQKKKIKEEVYALHKILPDVPKKPKKLDPWLRLHLYAQRLEATYQDFEKRLDAPPGYWPTGPGQLINGEYHGEGPYLGIENKFTILLLNKKSGISRFAQAYAGYDPKAPLRAYLWEDGTLFFGTACDFADGAYSNDSSLHAHLTFHVVSNLICAVKNFTFEPPFWWREGLCHWYARRVSDQSNNFSAVSTGDEDLRTATNWGPKVRARVGHDYFPTAEFLLEREDWDGIKFSEQMMLWSRIDYLMTLNEDAFSIFTLGISSRINGKSKPTHAELMAAQKSLFQQAWGFDYATFDERWKTWVSKTYKRK